MSHYTTDEIVAAIERAQEVLARFGDRAKAEYWDLKGMNWRADDALLRALADAVREGVPDTYPMTNENGFRASCPVLVIPRPEKPE